MHIHFFRYIRTILLSLLNLAVTWMLHAAWLFWGVTPTLWLSLINLAVTGMMYASSLFEGCPHHFSQFSHSCSHLVDACIFTFWRISLLIYWIYAILQSLEWCMHHLFLTDFLTILRSSLNLAVTWMTHASSLFEGYPYYLAGFGQSCSHLNHACIFSFSVMSLLCFWVCSIMQSLEWCICEGYPDYFVEFTQSCDRLIIAPSLDEGWRN